MKPHFAIFILAAACGSASPSTPAARAAPQSLEPRVPDDAIVDTMLARLGKAASCPASRRVWCIPADGWARGEAPDLAASDRALVGITVALERDREDVDLLSTEVALSVLALRAKGHDHFGLITDIPPENPSEQRIVRAAVNSIGKVLKGESDRVALAPSLVSHVETYLAQASYPMARAGGAWTMTGKSPARLRKVGDAWVAIEIPQSGPQGIFVSIYPD